MFICNSICSALGHCGIKNSTGFKIVQWSKANQHIQFILKEKSIQFGAQNNIFSLRKNGVVDPCLLAGSQKLLFPLVLSFNKQVRVRTRVAQHFYTFQIFYINQIISNFSNYSKVISVNLIFLPLWNVTYKQ